jgi:hypothetical protein
VSVTVFTYPGAVHVRRHGPRGYADYKHYKPWLRDEFSFRCVYRLCRETWLPDGEAHFGVDHVYPKSQATGPSSEYDSLVYACCVCNACKKDSTELIGLDILAPAEHLAVQPDGSALGVTRTGRGSFRMSPVLFFAFRPFFRLLGSAESPRRLSGSRRLARSRHWHIRKAYLRSPSGSSRAVSATFESLFQPLGFWIVPNHFGNRFQFLDILANLGNKTRVNESRSDIDLVRRNVDDPGA